jgi:hypothetical protein
MRGLSRSILLLPILAAAFYSCTIRQLDEVRPADPGKRMEFTATVENDALTRSTLGDNYKFLWSPGERVNLFYGDSENTPGSLFVSQNQEPAASAVFSGEIDAFTGGGAGSVPLTFWSVSPYMETNRCDGVSVQATLPAVQHAVEENFANNTMLLVANSPGLTLSYLHVGTFLRLCVTNSDISAITFMGNKGEIVGGRVSVEMDANGKPVWSALEGEGRTAVRLEGPDGGCFVPGKYYLLTFLPQTFQGGWSLVFETLDGRVAKYTKSDAATFVRANSKNATNRDNGLTFVPMYVDMGNGLKWATMNLGAGSPEAYGDYYAWGEISPKANYSQGTYTATAFRDAATAQLGGEWRTPTESDWTWLRYNCTWTSATINGQKGFTVTSNVAGYESSSIFIPKAGYINGTTKMMAGQSIYNWSSTPTGDQAIEMQVSNTGRFYIQADFRYLGMPIRPVKGYSAADRPYVEMGPGVKWATTNVGAASPEECGNYYAWGETAVKQSYYWNTYRFGTETALTKYVLQSEFGTIDGRQTLEPEDDAATVAWGGEWRTPTYVEWNWLLNSNNTTITRTEQNGMPGYLITSKVSGYEGNSIFLPIAGYFYGTSTSRVGQSSGYWTSSLQTDYSPSAVRAGLSVSSEGRPLGMPVRPVRMARVPVTGITLYDQTITVGVDLTYRVSFEVTPENATEPGVVWTSTNPSVATVNGEGVVRGISPGTTTIQATTLDGNYTSGSCTVTVIESFVDMGGGMEWATFNVGAESPTDYGEYFAWGETSFRDPERQPYSWNYYLLGREDYLFSYCERDGLVSLLPRKDAATMWWGGLWHIPSAAEWQWLADHSSSAEVTVDNVKGRRITSTVTGNSIFLPYAGTMINSGLNGGGTYGRYWSSSITEDEGYFYYESACSPQIDATSFDPTVNSLRYLGMTLRPVRRKAVDMGGGLKWATANVGGFEPGDTGDYFAWGETLPKADYSVSTYKWCVNGSMSQLTKYITDEYYAAPGYSPDHLTRLILNSNSTDDAARANWGASWRTPTSTEWEWLLDNCTWTWTDDYGGDSIRGHIIQSNVTGNSIFLPAAGLYDGTHRNDYGPYLWRPRYWSSNLGENPTAGLGLQTTTSVYELTDYSRKLGLTVRAVTE